MLEPKDLQAIAELIDARVTKSENLILGELVKIEDTLLLQIEQVKKNLEELNQYYRITRLENNNTTLLLKMIEGLEKEVEELKKKIA